MSRHVLGHQEISRSDNKPHPERCFKLDRSHDGNHVIDGRGVVERIGGPRGTNLVVEGFYRDLDVWQPLVVEVFLLYKRVATISSVQSVGFHIVNIKFGNFFK